MELLSKNSDENLELLLRIRCFEQKLWQLFSEEK